MLEFDRKLNLIKQAKYKYDLQNVEEPNLYREIYDYEHIPKIAFNMRHVPEDMPDEIWITDTTFRDGQQSVSPFTPEQIVHLFKLMSRLSGPNGVVRQGIRAIKAAYPDCYVITDVCMCEYTDHGHCGILHDHEVDNDKTLEVLAKTALSHVQAGADMVAPSDMMDGRVAAIRTILDENGFETTPIMSYSAKYASAFYGPFRDAAGSAPSFGDRRGYQMDPHNRKEALKECALDVQEGADILMVKPALSYLDIIRECADAFDLPMAAYSVSGEYAMIKAAGKEGLIDEHRVICESALSIYRAGADILITYFAKELAQAMKRGELG